MLDLKGAQLSDHEKHELCGSECQRKATKCLLTHHHAVEQLTAPQKVRRQHGEPVTEPDLFVYYFVSLQ